MCNREFEGELVIYGMGSFIRVMEYGVTICRSFKGWGYVVASCINIKVMV